MVPPARVTLALLVILVMTVALAAAAERGCGTAGSSLCDHVCGFDVCAVLTAPSGEGFDARSSASYRADGTSVGTTAGPDDPGEGAFLGFLERRLGDRATAEDLLQIAFLRLVERRVSARDDESLLPWFTRS